MHILTQEPHPTVSGIIHLISYHFMSSPTTIVCIIPQRRPPETNRVSLHIMLILHILVLDLTLTSKEPSRRTSPSQ